MARQFDGVDDRVAVTDPARWDFGLNPFTVMVWSRTNGDIASKPIVMKDNFAGNSAGFYLYYQSERNAAYWNGTVVTSITAANERWNHIAIIRTDTGTTGTRAYYNGSAAVQFQENRNLTNPLNVTFASAADGTFSAVRLAHVTGWNRALSSDEIISCMRRPASVHKEALIGYWPLYGGSPEADWSGNRYDGTLTGTTVPEDNPGVNEPWMVPVPMGMQAL